MEFTYIADGIDAIVIDNFYTESQLDDIFKELAWITKPQILVGESSLATAEDGSGNFLASKKGIFIDKIIQYWRHSALMSYPMDNMNTQEFRNKIVSYNSLYKILFSCNRRDHLLSYYQNNDFYKAHTDASVFTILNYFYKEPKQFSGGEIILRSFTSTKEAEIEIKNNRIVIIPGCTEHEVKAITSNLTDNYSGNGRYCVAMFLTIPESKEARERIIK